MYSDLLFIERTKRSRKEKVGIALHFLKELRLKGGLISLACIFLSMNLISACEMKAVTLQCHILSCY